jgi:hypothetical protein
MLRVQALQAAAAASNDPAMKEALTQDTEAAAAAAAAEHRDAAGSPVAADGAASAATAAAAAPADGAAGTTGLLAEVGVVQTLRARVAELEAELRQVGGVAQQRPCTWPGTTCQGLACSQLCHSRKRHGTCARFAAVHHSTPMFVHYMRCLCMGFAMPSPPSLHWQTPLLLLCTLVCCAGPQPPTHGLQRFCAWPLQQLSWLEHQQAELVLRWLPTGRRPPRPPRANQQGSIEAGCSPHWRHPRQRQRHVHLRRHLQLR